MTSLDDRVKRWIKTQHGTAMWEQKLLTLFHEELARRDREIIKKIKLMPTVSEYNTLEMVGHPYNAQAVITHEAISREDLLSTLLEDKRD